ncbi:MAG: hypothetical protein OWQ50_00555 [Acidianus infernus]|nr:hypothetical protein [Acidianus infernus]
MAEESEKITKEFVFKIEKDSRDISVEIKYDNDKFKTWIYGNDFNELVKKLRLMFAAINKCSLAQTNEMLQKELLITIAEILSVIFL